MAKQFHSVDTTRSLREAPSSFLEPFLPGGRAEWCNNNNGGQKVARAVAKFNQTQNHAKPC